ncbi:ATP-dependent DNA helicase, RecQ family protein [Babesia divergens]|uniref:DNA 3'-5' helicase n=1 Tax=Babesia divergens TaxID=32595 RepID=A0AAD9LG51_BABDI|nr:ATP-dependent DNA helicase, RecQ family protein [Babesia divergens]
MSQNLLCDVDIDTLLNGMGVAPFGVGWALGNQNVNPGAAGDNFPRRAEQNTQHSKADDELSASSHAPKANGRREHFEASGNEVITVPDSYRCSTQEYAAALNLEDDALLQHNNGVVAQSPDVCISHLNRIVDTDHYTAETGDNARLQEAGTRICSSDIDSEPVIGSHLSNDLPLAAPPDNRPTAVIYDTKYQDIATKPNLIKDATRNEEGRNVVGHVSERPGTKGLPIEIDEDVYASVPHSNFRSDTPQSTAVHLILSLQDNDSELRNGLPHELGENVCQDTELCGLTNMHEDGHTNIDEVMEDIDLNPIAYNETDLNGMSIQCGDEAPSVIDVDMEVPHEILQCTSDEDFKACIGDISTTAVEVHQSEIEDRSVAGGSCRVSSRTVSRQSTEDISITTTSCRTSRSRVSSTPSKSSISRPDSSTPVDSSEPEASSEGSKHSVCNCINKGDNSIMGEAISFFALKHVLELVREVGECLSSDDAPMRWQDVLDMQARAQRFVNEAVRVNFQSDDLKQYQLSLPKTLGKFTYAAPAGTVEATRSAIEKPVEINRKLSNTQGGSIASHRDIYTTDMDVQPMMEGMPGMLPEPSQSEMAVCVQNEALKDYDKGTSVGAFASLTAEQMDMHIPPEPPMVDNGLPKIRTFSELKRSCASDFGETLPSKRTKNGKECKSDHLQDEDDDLFGLDYSLQEEAGDISNLCDPLAEARKLYMEKINSNEIPGMDLRVLRDVRDTYAQLFGENFEFSRKVNEINSSVFGYNGFRGIQLAAINSVLLGKDCFVMMATGGGKSHCFQLPSKLLGGVVVVFSPLISLMEDQRRVMEHYGINAETVDANTTSAEMRKLSKRYLDHNEIFKSGSILFITPEKFDKSAAVLRLLDDLHTSARLKLFVIDEAHCVSQWGLSFRTDYRKLCNLKVKFPDVPILAMTATATRDVATDIIQVLRIPTCVRLRTTINRPNLWIECREKTKDYLKEMIEILKTTTGCGIVYTLTVSDCEKVARELENASISVGAYHAKLDATARKEVQRRWTRGEIRVMAATIAFGMGIDKSDVRFVFHTSAPVSILGYYQEIGRAGRDGKYSTTILWYNLRDFERHKNLGQKVTTSRKMVIGEEVSDFPTLSNMREYCQNKSVCRRLLLFRAFGEDPEGVLPANCQGCDNCCLNMMSERVDATEDALIVCKFVEETTKYYVKGILTMNILCDALRGSNRSTIVRYGLCNSQYHGALKHHKPKYIFHVIQELVNLRVLRECRRKRKSFEYTVMLLGVNARKLNRGLIQVNVICYKPLAGSPLQGPAATEMPDSTVALGMDEGHVINTTTESGANAVAPQSKSRRKRSKSKDYLQNNADLLASSVPEKAAAPMKGVSPSQIVEALKAANTMRRRDSDCSDSFIGENKQTASALSVTTDNYLNLMRHGHRGEPSRAKPAFTTVAPDKVIIRGHGGLRAMGNNESSVMDAVGNDTIADANEYGLMGSVAMKDGKDHPHADSIQDLRAVHADQVGSKQAPHGAPVAGGSTWRTGLSKAMMLITNGKSSSHIDIQVARQNNIRRKVPLDLLSSLT